MKMSLFPYLLVMLAGVLNFSACTDDPVACMDGRDEYFVLNPVSFSNCSQNAAYTLWIYNGNRAMEGEVFERTYSESGSHEITLECYGKNGKKKDTSTRVFLAGYKYVTKVTFYTGSKPAGSSATYAYEGNVTLGVDGTFGSEMYSSVGFNTTLTFTFAEPVKISSGWLSMELKHNQPGGTSIANITVKDFHRKYDNPFIHDNFTIDWELR